MEFLTIEYTGRVKVNAVVTGMVKGAHSEDMIYLEWGGAEAAVRAIWAHLVGSEVRKSGVAERATIGGKFIQLQPYTKYINFKGELKNGQHVMGIRHPRSTIKWTGNRGRFYIVEPADFEGVPAGFVQRLASMLSFPIDLEWADWLWQDALEAGKDVWNPLVGVLDSMGTAQGWKVNPDSDEWLKLIQKHLGAQHCESCHGLSKDTVLVTDEVELYKYLLYPYSKPRVICTKCRKESEVI